MQRETYWHSYFDQEVIRRSDSLREEHFIDSTGVRIHIDVYRQGDDSGPVIILNHGGGSYSRMFIPIALVLHERGYTVVLPDQRGQGFSGGDRGDFLVSQFVENIIDAARWARERFKGRIFMAGVSVGSGFAYGAAMAGAPVAGVVCHNLYSFSSPKDAMAVSRFASMAAIPGCARLVHWLNGMSARLLPHLKVPIRWFADFRNMVDARDGNFYEIWKQDPLPIRSVSLRYLASTSRTPPAIPFENNTLPILVLNPTLDQMVSAEVTKASYGRLGGPKSYEEIPYGHWSVSARFAAEWTEIVDGWLRKQLGQSAPSGHGI